MPDDRLDDCPVPEALAAEGPDAIRGDAPAAAARPDLQQTLALRVSQRNLQRNERLARLRPAPAIAPAIAPAAAPAAPKLAEADPETVPRAPARSGLGLVAPASSSDAALEEFLRALTGGLALAGAEAAETKALEAKGLETKAIETKSGGAGTSAEREAAGILRFPAPQPGVSDMAPEAVPETTPETTPETALGPITAPTTVLASLPAEAPIEAGTPMEILADILACDLDQLPGVGPGLIWALRRAGIARLADLAPLAPEALAARLGPLGRLVPAARWIETARAAR